MIQIANKTYEVVVDHKNGWKPDAFRDRYSEVLERYDFIVGDWGYNQLRLRGFFKDAHPKATKETSIATLQDYLNEYCNFGCAYFIIEKIPNKQQANQPQDSTEEADQELQEKPVNEQQQTPEQREPSSNREQPKENPQPQQNQNQHPRRNHPNHHNKENNQNQRPPRNQHYKQSQQQKQAQQNQQNQQHVKQ
ncbi:YutD family protein [Paenibacillus sp. UNC451MF]|uniref:YutD family protein n=1 Tax=Paenibacillus sp. UNC451MF TaxID=1449063 RepID=UPI00048C830E|nr:YutD family protein [Paenibacillus sp. UNC451MF]